MKTYLFKSIQLILLVTFFSTLHAASFRNYVSHEMIGTTTLRIWINSDTAFGEKAIAEVRWDTGGGGYAYTGLIDGTFDTSQPGANWRVDLTIPMGTNNIDYQLGNKNESNSVYGLTDFPGNMLVALPVELAFFNAKSFNNHHLLSWQTVSENNNSHFNIERSNDSKTWINIGRVSGNGTTQQTHSYSFNDNTPKSGISYYRLKQVDYDGHFSYSPIKHVSKKSLQPLIYPNPVGNMLTIGFNKFKEGENHMLILKNMQGQLILQQQCNTPLIYVDMNKLATGLYSVYFLDKFQNIISIQKLSKL